MNYTINLELQTYIPKNNKLPLRLRVSINGKIGYITLGRKIEANQYNFKKKQLRTGIKGYTNLYNYISEQEKILRNILQEAEIHGENLTHSKLKERYKKQTGKTATLDLFEYILEEIEHEQKYSQVKNSSLHTYKSTIKIAKQYKSKVSIHEVDKNYLERLISYLRANNTAKGTAFSENAIYGVLIVLKKYIKRLFDNGEIKTYPFKDLKIGSPPEVSFVYLTPDELNILHDIYKKGTLADLITNNKKVAFKKNGEARQRKIDNYNNALKTYLISCYTGLRFSDMNLKRENLVSNYIVKEVKKTRLGKLKIVRIPVRQKLKSLINYNATDNNIFDLKPISNTTVNLLLKDIAEVAGIKKYLHFHTARHTFATISLMLGMRLEVIKDILGHSDVKMTLRYAHIVDKIRDNEMDKWDVGLKEDGFSDDENKEQITCPKCKNQLLSFDKGLINLKSIPVTCTYCDTEFLHQIHIKKKLVFKFG